MSAAVVIAWGPTVGCIYRGSVVCGLSAALLLVMEDLLYCPIAGYGNLLLSYCWLWKSTVYRGQNSGCPGARSRLPAKNPGSLCLRNEESG